MALILPNLDDKSFQQIADESRLLIPSTAPEWTDHNVHDPGITFAELFAWLAEISHYRLNRTSAASYQRFFALMGVTPLAAQAAAVSVAFEFNPLAQGVLAPANTKMWAIGLESLPFQTLRDQYLTKAKVKRVVTVAGGFETVQTTAEKNEVGHYEAFGPAPAIGDFLRVEFDDWFEEPEGQIDITLFEDDLPPRKPLPATTPLFEPSATVRWEFRSDPAGATEEVWTELDVIQDETLSLSRSGCVIFRSPDGADAVRNKELRALLTAGQFEIPPRIVSIRTNTVRARQVETIVNEDLKAGLGTADQAVRLQKWPVFVNTQIDDGPFQVGEVLDWRALVGRLREADTLYQSPLKETVLYLVERLNDLPDADINLQPPPGDDPLLRQEYALAQAFEQLIDDDTLYQKSKFKGISVPDELLESGRCKSQSSTRSFNRLLLQLVFPDLFVGDRIEVQVGMPAARVEDEVTTWRTFQQVEDFQKSGPDDAHYVLDADTGTILFGNGLNGRVPQTTELIRARFYRYSRLEEGNITANHQWVLAAVPAGTPIVKRANLAAAAGGAQRETLDDTKIRTREVFRKQHAVLTGADYETLALTTPGLRVTRAKVIPNFSPKFPCLTLPGEVTLIVEPQPPPQAAFPNAPPAQASEGFLATIQNTVDSRRVVTTNIHVIGPRYVEVSVSGRVFLKKRVSEPDALESIKRALEEFLDPVFGGPERGQGWPFGRSIFPSEISQQLAKVAGVDYVTKIAINDLAPGEALELPYDGLPTSGTHAITTVAFEKRVNGQQGNNCD